MTDAMRIKAEEFKQTIMESEEYQKYDMYRRLLNETPELKDRINEFRKANISLQMEGNAQNRDEVQRLSAEYNDAMTSSVVREFLNAELILCKMLQQINLMLISDIELELDFL